MSDDLISVIDVAARHQKHKQTVFKVLHRLGIEPRKVRSATSKNQLVAYITQAERALVAAELAELVTAADSDEISDFDDFVSAEVGVFYLIQLEPSLDPCRFKLGFASNMGERLRQLRCSSPYASVIAQWPCRKRWERTAIDCITAGCEQLHTEVFRTGSVDDVKSKCDKFFEMFDGVLSRTGHARSSAVAVSV